MAPPGGPAAPAGAGSARPSPRAAGAGGEDGRIRSLRPPKAAVDPGRPLGVLAEEERLPGGGRARVVTVFLAGAECPFTCVFCDLWRHTLERPTPAGSLPTQLRDAFARLGPEALAGAHVKLYNASNFFDPRAVPAADEAALLELLHPFPRVVVESHPAFVGERCLRFADRLAGRLEVAIGLETVHPGALPRLNKKMTLADFDRAAARLAAAGIGLRAFVLVGAPFVPAGEAVEWAVRSAAYAFARGAGVVALIPVRGGNGEMERLQARGEFTPPTLAELEEALERSLEAAGGRVVVADLWDLERFARCPACLPQRAERLRRLNLDGRAAPRAACPDCGG